VEIILNIAWAICSIGLIWFWTQNNASNLVPLRTQILALAMIVLLLLPVISLSDDLIAMQGPAEADTCLRKALHSNEIHPSAIPASFALPEDVVAALSLSWFSQDVLQAYRPTPPPAFLNRSLDSRPPPHA
jgi:hypothetical protein